MPIAEALVAGGLPVLEVTLRTPAALDAIRAMSACRARSSAPAPCSIPASCARRSTPARHSRSARASPSRSAAPPPRPACPSSPASPARRHHARPRSRLLAAQILPRRGRRRAAGAEGAGRRVRRRPLLPDRRHHPGQRRRPGSTFPSSPASAAAGWCPAGEALDPEAIRRRARGRRRPPPRAEYRAARRTRPVAYDTGFR